MQSRLSGAISPSVVGEWVEFVEFVDFVESVEFVEFVECVINVSIGHFASCACLAS